jgi:hypothetical protein
MKKKIITALIIISSIACLHLRAMQGGDDYVYEDNDGINSLPTSSAACESRITQTTSPLDREPLDYHNNEVAKRLNYPNEHFTYQR